MADVNLFRGEPNRRELADGEWLFAAGDPAAEMYAVVEGGVEVVVDDRVVETVPPGGFLGEVALLGPGRRTAGARAAGPTTVAVIDEKRFLVLVRTNPYFSLEVMRVLAARLGRTAG
jgi:CRP-like cAMP-binding protein